MTVFRLGYLIHFALGVWVAVRLWLAAFAVLRLVNDLDITWPEVVSTTLISTLVGLWYFLWIGSLLFVLNGKFPLISTRTFGMLMAIVYLAAGVRIASIQAESFTQAMENLPVVILVLAGVLALAMGTLLVLPKMQLEWQREKMETAHLREDRLDQMHRVTDPRIRP